MPQELTFAAIESGVAVKYLKEQFAQHHEDEIEANVDPRTRRTSGVSYRTIGMVFADGQAVSLDIKDTGDIFAVKLNGKPLPIRAQDSEPEAIAEICKAMDAGRARFQQQQLRQKVQLPASIRTPVPKLEVVLQQKHEELDQQIHEALQRRDELRNELAVLPALDDVHQPDPNFFSPDLGDHQNADVTIERNNELNEGEEPRKDDAGHSVPLDTVDKPTEDAQAASEQAGKIDQAAREPVQAEADRAIAAKAQQADDSRKPFEGINYPQGEDLADSDQLRVSMYY